MTGLWVVGVISSTLWALSVGEWVALITAVTGTGLISTLVSGGIAMRRLRLEQTTTVRTVAAEEAEIAVRIMGAAMADLRTRLTVCEDWRREHLLVCPMARRRERHDPGTRGA